LGPYFPANRRFGYDPEAGVGVLTNSDLVLDVKDNATKPGTKVIAHPRKTEASNYVRFLSFGITSRATVTKWILRRIRSLVQAIVLLGMDDDDKMRWCHKIISALDQEVDDCGIGQDVYTPLLRRTMDAYSQHIRHIFANFSPTPSNEIASLLFVIVSYSINHTAYDGVETLAKLSISNS
jgi:hypothetical protein